MGELTLPVAREWTQRFRGHLCEIVAEHLVVEAPAAEDYQRATDLMVLRGGAARIACRVRRRRFLERYGNQFTIRSRVPSGGPTELDKVLAGWGDFMIYGFAAADHINDDEGERLAAWTLIDLDVFRHLYGDGIYSEQVVNGDGTAGTAFWFRDWPLELVVAHAGADLGIGSSTQEVLF